MFANNSPCCNFIRQATKFNNEVLPAPEGPIIADIYPDLNIPEALWIITFYYLSEKQDELSLSASTTYLTLVNEISTPLH